MMPINTAHWSESTRKLNAHLLDPAAKEQAALIANTLGVSTVAPSGGAKLSNGKRLRQSSKPLLNKLETAFLEEYLQEYYTPQQIHPQRFQLRLANGLRYKPDFVTITGNGCTCWEAKGPHSFRGGFENLKSAAALFIGITFILVWKDSGEWKQQIILP